MAVISNTGTLTPLVNTEATVATIAGGPFDNVTAYVQGGDSGDGKGQLLFRLYAIVGGLQSLVAMSQVIASPVPVILQWQSPGEGNTESQFVAAGGTSYELTVTALPGPLRNPLTATLAGVDEFDVAVSASISTTLLVPPFTEVSSPNVAGFAQFMDVAVNQANLPQEMTVTIYANNGVGSVEAAVDAVTLSGRGPDAITVALRKTQLPVASVYRVGIRNDTTGAITVPFSVATYSVAAVSGGGGGTLTPAAGEVGVSGPLLANLITPAGAAGENLRSPLIAGVVSAQWESPTADPSWLQATWFVDPQNSTGTASDANSGIDAAHAVLTYRTGVAQKWGTFSPVLSQNTTLTWLSSELGSDPVVLEPIMVGTVCVIQGLLTPANTIHTGTLAGVVSKNRATPQLLEADLGFAAPIGTLVSNTTAGKISYAWVYKNVSGTVFALTQPLVPAVIPVSLSSGPLPAEVDTWANGDSFVVYAPTGINLVRAASNSVVGQWDAPNFPEQIQIYNARFTASNGPGQSIFSIGQDASIVECQLDSVLVDVANLDGNYQVYWNIFANNDAYGQGSNLLKFWLGGALVAIEGSEIGAMFDFDAIFDASAEVSNISFTRFLSAFDAPNQGTFYIDGQCRLSGGQTFISSETFSGATFVWGPGSLDTCGFSRFVYRAPAVNTFLLTGGMYLNNQGDAVAFDNTTGLWTTLIPINPVNLDKTIALGGFGGTAINPSGSAYTTQAGA